MASVSSPLFNKTNVVFPPSRGKSVVKALWW